MDGADHLVAIHRQVAFTEGYRSVRIEETFLW
jgi:hypothetical protein